MSEYRNLPEYLSTSGAVTPVTVNGYVLSIDITSPIIGSTLSTDSTSKVEPDTAITTYVALRVDVRIVSGMVYVEFIPDPVMTQQAEPTVSE